MTDGYQQVMAARRDVVHRALAASEPERVGIVRAQVGLSVDVTGISAAPSDIVEIGDLETGLTAAEVVAVTPDALRCMPLETSRRITIGMPARRSRRRLGVPVGPTLRGRVLNGLGEPIDNLGPLRGVTQVDVDHDPPNPLLRKRVTEPMPTGVRALDAMIPAGKGQRLGLFAGSGVGKSSLLSMIARGTSADTVVMCLVGERGREVRDFIEDDLGSEGLARSVVVVSTSDQPAAVRLRAARLATRIAEYHRDQGDDVLLMMDSLTRCAMAQREIGLATGEVPATRGYPPSTFSMLAKLLERGGPGMHGSITGVYTVLVDGDDMDEPIADAARSLLDGHVVLSRSLSHAGHFPSIDVLQSVSRVVGRVTDDHQRALMAGLRQVLAARREAQDLIDVGAYVRGANPLVDVAVAHQAEIDAFLTQDIHETCTLDAAWSGLGDVMAQLAATLEADTAAEGVPT